MFEIRDLNLVQQDYDNRKWISKQELIRLYKSEQDFAKTMQNEADKCRKEYSELLSSFNLNALQNYELLERKFQGRTKS